MQKTLRLGLLDSGLLKPNEVPVLSDGTNHFQMVVAG